MLTYNHPIPISGTAGNNVIQANFAAADALHEIVVVPGDEGGYDPNNPNNGEPTEHRYYWSREVFANGGDDIINRDRVGDYKVTAEFDENVRVHGDAGCDTVSYAGFGAAISADLQHDGVGGWDLDGWVTLRGGAPAGQTIYGRDVLSSVENLTGTSYGDLIRGSSGANQLNGGGGGDEIHGEGGNDTVSGGDGSDELFGGSGNDVLQGGNHDDALDGGSGNDRLEGGSGSDVLEGGSGIDTAVYTGSGGDVAVSLTGGYASGGEGEDQLSGIENVETGGGVDFVTGNGAANMLSGGGGADLLMGEGGADVLQGGSGHDVLDGGSSGDALYGGSGDNLFYGGSGNDNLIGETGADEIHGGEGNDAISAGAGEDYVRGGQGNDVMTSGSGADDFVWGDGDAGYDTIAEFNMAEDQFVFEAGFLELGVGDQPEDALMVFDSGAHSVLAANTSEWGWVEIALIENVDAAQLGQGVENGSLVDDGGDLVFG